MVDEQVLRILGEEVATSLRAFTFSGMGAAVASSASFFFSASSAIALAFFKSVGPHTEAYFRRSPSF